MSEAAHNLRQKTVRGLKFTSAATVVKTLVDFAGQLIIARALLKEDFGIFASVQALSGFVSCFSDLAGQKFLVQRKTSDHSVVSSVFWFELSLGIAVALLWFVGCVPLLTALGRTHQIPFAQVASLWIVAERLLLPRAVLDRALRFGRVNLALLVGVVAGSAAMITAAESGLGAWSLYIGLITRTVVSGVWVWIAAGFVPRLVIDREVARELWRFGGPLLATTALTFAYTNVDYLIVGQMLGDARLGIYERAYRYPHYMIQFNMILASVVFPAFALAKDNEHVARGLRLITRYSGTIGFAAMIAMWMEGGVLTRVALGDPQKWAGALFPFQVFTTLAGLRLTFTHWGHIFVVRGNTRPLLVASIVNLPMIVVAASVGAWWADVPGAAVLVAVSTFGTIAVCCFVVLKRVLEFSYLEALGPVLRATLVTVVAMLGMRAVSPDTTAFGFVRLVIGGGVYAGMIWMQCRHEIVRLVRNRA